MTHVLEQRASNADVVSARRPASDMPPRITPIDDAFEHEADRVVTRLLASPARGGLLQRACSCGGTPGPDGECAECRAERLDGQGIPSVAWNGIPEETVSDLDIYINQSPGETDVPEEAGTPEPAATACPTSIKVAEITPVEVTADQVAKGVRAGWGAITRMEVSGGGRKDWDGTKVRENLSKGTNDCDKQPACANSSGQGGNAGSIFTVGGASPAFKHPKLGEVIPAMPATKNSFFDIHVQGGGVDWCAASGSCARSCTQRFACGGTAFGPTFTVSWSYATVSRKTPKGGSFSVCAATFTKA